MELSLSRDLENHMSSRKLSRKGDGVGLIQRYSRIYLGGIEAMDFQT